MRRRSGNQLVVNELRVLVAALRLSEEGSEQLYGYELFALLREWGGEAPMDHGTLYRCLRNLENRSYFSTEVRLAGPHDRRARVYYALTVDGRAAAVDAVAELSKRLPSAMATLRPVARELV
jgi:DNA-binding PadR family transcriptional regulator